MGLFSHDKFRARTAVVVTAAAILAGIAPAAITTPAQAAPKAPSRIISLSPSATEILWGIGASKQVIAVDDNSNFPSGVPTTKLSSFTPNVEAIAGYQPDLVILQANATAANSVAKNLKKLGIKVWVEQTPNNIKEAFTEFATLGQLTGHKAQAATLVKVMKAKIADIVATYKFPRTKTFVELDNTYYSATSKTFLGAVLKDFGLANIADAAAGADKTGYPQLTAEYIVKANPKLILLTDADWGETFATVKARAGWDQIAAVKNAKVFGLSADVSSRWGPRLVDFYQSVADAVASVK
jgi:iron complex transport system substrate-binding protein